MLSNFSSAYWKQLLGIDLRSLAAFRVMLAIAVMAELIYMLPSVDAFFSDSGLFPRQAIIARNPVYTWSLYLINGTSTWSYLLLSLNLLAALALLVGYRSRLAVIVCWVLHNSFVYRTISIGSSMYSNDLLFWAMFLPLGARFSIDAALSKRPKEENAYVSVATLAILLQVTYLYFFGALHKTGSMWQESRDAIYYVLNTPRHTSPLAIYLAPWVKMARGFTVFTYYLELAAAFFFFSPFKNAMCRLAILPFLVSLHIGFALFMSIGIFPLVSISGLMVFIPGLFWDWLLPRFNARNSRTGITMYYDEDCGFCRKTCLIFRELGLPPETRILPAQQFPEIYAIMQREKSWVLEDGSGSRHTRWDAVAWCWRRSPLLWPLGVLFIPTFMQPVGNIIYGFIARHRPSFGRLSGRFLAEHDRTLAFKPYTITQWLLMALIAMTPFWCMLTLPNRPYKKLPDSMWNIMIMLGLEQGWTMFSPDVPDTSHWIVIEGQLADGRMVDMWNNLPEDPSNAEPANGYTMYYNHQWEKFFNAYHQLEELSNDGAFQQKLGRYFCSKWKDTHGSEYSPLKAMTFSAYSQQTAHPFAPVMEIKKLGTFTYNCGM